MVEEAHVALEQLAEIADAVFQHRDTVDAHAPGEALIHIGIDVAGAQHVGVHHAAAEDLHPVGAFAEAHFAGPRAVALDVDLKARFGAKALPYAAQLTDAGLARLAKEVDGISVDKSLLLNPTEKTGEASVGLVARAHATGLTVFSWTLRPENRFLEPRFRMGTPPRDWGDWRGEFEAVLATGLDGIFVDHPDLGVAARDAVGVSRET